MTQEKQVHNNIQCVPFKLNTLKIFAVKPKVEQKQKIWNQMRYVSLYQHVKFHKYRPFRFKDICFITYFNPTLYALLPNDTPFNAKYELQGVRYLEMPYNGQNDAYWKTKDMNPSPVAQTQLDCKLLVKETRHLGRGWNRTSHSGPPLIFSICPFDLIKIFNETNQHNSLIEQK